MADFRRALNAAKRITTAPIPNAYGTFTQVRVDGEPVGVYKTVEGGFLPIGKIKPRKTEAEAQYALIHSRGLRLLTEGERLMGALKELGL